MWNLENGIDDLIGKAESETQIQRTNVDIKGGYDGGMNLGDGE